MSLQRGGKSADSLSVFGSCPEQDPPGIEADFTNGGSELTSYVRPGKLFTANEALMIESVGQLNADKLRVIIKVVAELFTGEA